MKKLFRISAMIVLITAVMPTVCMKTDRLVRFAGDFNVIPIKESNLEIMGAWDSHYKKHKAVVDSGGIVPRFTNVSADELTVVNNALNVGAYKFDGHYKELSSDDKRLLIKASGLYDDDGKRLKLYVPELTIELIDVYFTDTGLRNYIKSFCNHDDQEDVRNYCRKQLIENKRGLLPLKQLMFTGTRTLVRESIYPGSLFLNGYHTNYADSPIPFSLGSKVHQMYAHRFITDTHEHRIADIKGKQCSLWVINHDNLNDKNYTFSAPIEHKGEIKGCVLSKTGTGVEYAVTYSDCDIVVSKITTHNDISFVESISMSAATNGIIVDVCFNHAHDRLIIGQYKGMNSLVESYTMDLAHCLSVVSFPFKKHGLLEKIFIVHHAPDNVLVLVFGIAEQYELLYYHAADHGTYEFFSSSGLMKIDQDRDAFLHLNDVFKRDDSIFLYDCSLSSFQDSFIAEQEKSKENWFIKELVNGSELQLNPECYRIYSPDGKFLLCNTLQKKSGIVYVETVIKDAITHQQILSIDTCYKAFVGIGFSKNGTELFFLNSAGHNYYVSLLNAEDNMMLQEMEKVVFTNLGITSLLKKLCMECKKKGEVTLCEDSPTCIMLMEWSRKSSIMKDLLVQCLPLCKLKK